MRIIVDQWFVYPTLALLLLCVHLYVYCQSMVLSCETFYRKFFPKLLLAVQTAAASYQHYQLMPLSMAFFAAQYWDQVLLDLTA